MIKYFSSISIGAAVFSAATAASFLAAGGCGHLTVAPPQVAARQVAFDENTPNAGIIDADSNGVLVTDGWVRRYRALEKKYEPGVHFIPCENIPAAANNFRISYECSDHGAALRQRERVEAGP